MFILCSKQRPRSMCSVYRGKIMCGWMWVKFVGPGKSIRFSATHPVQSQLPNSAKSDGDILQSAAPLCHTLSIEVSIPNEYSMTYMACWRLLLLVELLQLNEYVGFIKKTKIHTNCEQQTDFRTYQCSSPLHTDVLIVNT